MFCYPIICSFKTIVKKLSFVCLFVTIRILLKALQMTVSLKPRSASHQVTDMCGFGEGDAPHDQLVRTLFVMIDVDHGSRKAKRASSSQCT